MIYNNNIKLCYCINKLMLLFNLISLTMYENTYVNALQV